MGAQGHAVPVSCNMAQIGRRACLLVARALSLATHNASIPTSSSASLQSLRPAAWSSHIRQLLAGGTRGFSASMYRDLLEDQTSEYAKYKKTQGEVVWSTPIWMQEFRADEKISKFLDRYYAPADGEVESMQAFFFARKDTWAEGKAPYADFKATRLAVDECAQKWGELLDSLSEAERDKLLDTVEPHIQDLRDKYAGACECQEVYEKIGDHAWRELNERGQLLDMLMGGTFSPDAPAPESKCGGGTCGSCSDTGGCGSGAAKNQ